METYRKSVFAEMGIGDEFVQDDRSICTSRLVLRGLHLQIAPAVQGKLVRCAPGRICNVAADLRTGSPTHRRWVGTYLSSREQRIVWLPPGLACGFLALTDTVEVLYKHATEYPPDMLGESGGMVHGSRSRGRWKASLRSSRASIARHLCSLRSRMNCSSRTVRCSGRIEFACRRVRLSLAVGEHVRDRYAAPTMGMALVAGPLADIGICCTFAKRLSRVERHEAATAAAETARWTAARAAKGTAN